MLCAPFDGSLLASVYAVEHDRLWLVAQYGYAEVRDGFELEHGAMGRAIRTRTIQLVADAAGNVDAVAARRSIASEVAIPFQTVDGVAGVLNVESIGMSLPRSAGATLVPLASLLGERVAETREGLDSNVGDLVRLCVHASSLRGIGAIAELCDANDGPDPRPLVRAARPLARGRRPAEADQLLASARRPPRAARRRDPHAPRADHRRRT